MDRAPRLTVVRHAMPDHRPDQPPEQWQLSPAGHAAAQALAPRLPRRAHLVASAETRARRPGRLVGQSALPDAFEVDLSAGTADRLAAY